MTIHNKRKKMPITALLLAVSIALGLGASPTPKRKHLARPPLGELKFQPTGTRIRFDSRTNTYVKYEVNGRIDFDRRLGRYLLTWTGYDQQEQTLVYTPPNKVEATIVASVGYDSQNRLYRYTYAFLNHETSDQSLQSFYLEAGAPIQQSASPDASWYRSAFTPFLEKLFDTQSGMVWSQTMEGKLGVTPGQGASGFSILSSGPPTVVRCHVAAYRGALRTSGDLPEELHAAIDSVAWNLPSGRTVGPGRPSLLSDPDAFARSIADILRLSVEERWIESPKVAERYEKAIVDFTKEVKRGRKQSASVLLKEILVRLDNEMDITVLSEAYGLLRFNLENFATRAGLSP